MEAVGGCEGGYALNLQGAKILVGKLGSGRS